MAWAWQIGRECGRMSPDVGGLGGPWPDVAANVGGWAWLGVDRRAVGRCVLVLPSVRLPVDGRAWSMVARLRRLRLCDTFADCVTVIAQPQKPQNGL